MAMSIRSSHFIPTRTYASISWDDGKEVCLQRNRELEFSNQVPRSDYTILGLAIFWTSMPIRQPKMKIDGTMESSTCSRSSWIPLQVLLLYNSRIMMIPSVSTIKASDNIPVKGPLNNYYNIDPDTDFIRMVNQRGPTKPWKVALPIVRAVKGSKFAIIRDPTNKRVSRIYYQDPELHLRESYYDHVGTMGQWIFGEHIPKLCLSMNGDPSYFRWLHPQGTAAGDPHNCGSCPRW